MVVGRKRFLISLATLLVVSFFSVFTYSTVGAAPVPRPATGCGGNTPTEVTVNGQPMCDVAPVTPQPNPQDTRGSATDEGSASCAVEKIGWILCPIIEGTAKMADWLFAFLANHFLQVQPELFAENSGTRVAWEQARNLANVLFVIAFIILIYSQITGGVMSNYGIKRMLPRLIVAAVAVNVSYYICQGMVDISNILGFNIKEAISQIHDQQNLPYAMGHGGGAVDFNTGGGTLGVIASAALIVTGFVWLILALMGGMVTVILVTILTIVVVLLMRKAFIILLIVVSPLAFVAYLLPNTEKYFKKWLNMFWQLLMVFPIVALLMGAGELAGGIILGAGLQQTGPQCSAQEAEFNEEGTIECEPTYPVGNQQAPMSLGLAAAGIAVAPLLFVWSVLKGALAAAGAIGGRIASTVEKGGTSGAGYVQKKYKDTDFAKDRERKQHHLDAQVRAGTYKGKRPIKRFKSRVSRELRGSSLSVGGYKDLTAQALNQKEAKEAMDMFDGDADLMKVWAATGGDASKIAAARAELGIGDAEWGDGRQEKFAAMARAGHAHSAASFMAAASYLGESGKGSSADIANAVHAASHAGASASEQFAMFERARSAARKSGRADTLADLESWKGSGYSHQAMYDHDTGALNLASQDGVARAISQIGVGNLNYESLKGYDPNTGTTEVGSAGERVMPAFMQRISDPGNTTNIAGAVSGAMRAEGRTAELIEAAVIRQAARVYGARTSSGAPVQDLQQANNFFENRQGAAPRR